MKKIILSLCALVLSVASSVGAEEKILAITYVKQPLNIPSILEKRLGFLEEAFTPLGYKLSHPEITSGPQQAQAMAAGSVQVANCIGGTSLLLAASQGLDVKIAGIYSRAPKAFMLLVRGSSSQDTPSGQNIKEIQEIRELKGRKIAGPKGTVLHQMWLAALNKAGMAASDVEHIEMSIPASIAALMSGTIDGALAAGPGAAMALDSGARVLFDGEGLIEGTIVIGVGGKILREFPALPQMMRDAHHKALAYEKAHPKEALKLVSEETGLSDQQIGAMRGLYDFDPEVRSEDIAELERTMQFLLDVGLATTRVDPATLLADKE